MRGFLFELRRSLSLRAWLADELAALHRSISTMERRLETVMRQETQELIDEVSAIRSASDAAQALLDRIFAMIDNADDIAAVKQAVADLKSEKDELAAAVERNTPADPDTPPNV